MTQAVATALQQLPPAQRAQMILAAARNDMSAKLWQAALGQPHSDVMPSSQSGAMPLLPSFDLAALLAIGGHGDNPLLATDAPPAQAVSGTSASKGALALGQNDEHAPAIEAAAARTGIAASTLAAIVDAEAGRLPDGRWDPAARNPRSTATGLTQFLDSTWLSEAARAGTHLNQLAGHAGWLDERGRVRPAARAALLAQRLDPRHAIEAAADYARANLDRFSANGIALPIHDARAMARMAYLGHHLGARDALRFLSSGLDAGRARQLLASQIGDQAALRAIGQSGNATAAHRNWLDNYLERRINPDRFTPRG